MHLNYCKLSRQVHRFIVLSLWILIIQSCTISKNNKGSESNNVYLVSSNLLSDIDYNSNPQINYDSLILFDDSLFIDLDSNFQEILSDKFHRYKNN